MATKKISKASKRRLRLLAPISLVLIIYFLFTLFTYGYKLVSLKYQEKELKAKLVSLQAEESNLKTEIQKLKDPDYLARYARENYLYSKDGEYIIKIEDNKAGTKQEKNYDKYYEYIIYAAGAVGIIIVLYLIKKSRKK